jgi:hypothetical protein
VEDWKMEDWKVGMVPEWMPMIFGCWAIVGWSAEGGFTQDFE